MADDDDTTSNEPRTTNAPTWLPATLAALLLFGAGYAIGESGGPDAPAVTPIADTQPAPGGGSTPGVPGIPEGGGPGGQRGGFCPAPGGGGPGGFGPGAPRHDDQQHDDQPDDQQQDDNRQQGDDGDTEESAV